MCIFYIVYVYIYEYENKMYLKTDSSSEVKAKITSPCNSHHIINRFSELCINQMFLGKGNKSGEEKKKAK